MRPIFINVTLPQKSIYKIALLIVVVNFCLLAGTWVCNSIDWSKQNFFVSFLLRESNFAWENTVATWYSSMLSLIIAVLAIICFFSDRTFITGGFSYILNYGWVVVALIFTMLSLDEIGSIHESIGNLGVFKLKAAGSLASYVFYGLIAVVVLFMAVFGFLRFKNNKWAIFFGVVGVMCLLTLPLQEHIEWNEVIWNIQTGGYTRGALSIVIEEGTEIFGSLCFIICLYKYLTVTQKKYRLKNNLPNVNLVIDSRYLLLSAFMAVTFFILLNIIIQYEFYNVEKSDNGIAENWFPSMTSFVTFLLSLYLYLKNRNKPGKGYLWFSILTLFISLCFGSNLITRIIQKEGGTILPGLLLLAVIALIASITISRNKYFLVRIGLGIWITIFLLIFILKLEFASDLAFAGFCLLIICFFTALFKQTKKNDPNLTNHLIVNKTSS